MFTVFVINYCSEKESLTVNILKNINKKIAYHFHERGCAVGSSTHMLHLHIQSLKRKKKKKRKKIFSRMSVLSIYPFAFLCLCNLSMLPAAFKIMSKDQTIFLLFDVPQFPPQGIECLHAAARCLLLLLFFLFSFSSYSFCFFLKGTVVWDNFLSIRSCLERRFIIYNFLVLVEKILWDGQQKII